MSSFFLSFENRQVSFLVERIALFEVWSETRELADADRAMDALEEAFRLWAHDSGVAAHGPFEIGDVLDAYDQQAFEPFFRQVGIGVRYLANVAPDRVYSMRMKVPMDTGPE